MRVGGGGQRAGGEAQHGILNLKSPTGEAAASKISLECVSQEHMKNGLSSLHTHEHARVKHTKEKKSMYRKAERRLLR